MRKIAQKHSQSGISMSRAGATPVGQQRRFTPSITALIALSVVSHFGHAQQPPTSGDALREIQERPKTPLPSNAPSLEVQDKRRAVKPVQGLNTDVKAFRFTGLTVVREDELRAQVQSFIGPGKTFDDLQSTVDVVSEYLQRRGYIVAQAYLPEQKIENGIVEIAVLEGRLGQVHVDMEPDVPVSRSMIEGLLSPLTPGTILHRDVVERSLFLVSDLRGLNVRSIVEPGSTPGTSDLILKITTGRRVDGTVEFDNNTSRFTGDYRLGGSVNFNSPFHRGDLLSFRGLLGIPGGGADLDFGRVSYLTPIGNYGTKIGVAYLRLNYHLGTSLFDRLDQSGRSEVASIFGLHPIVRTRNFNLFGQASFDAREFVDTRGAVGLKSERKTKVGGLSVVGDSRDAYLGGGINNFSVAYTAGDLEIRTPADLAADQATGTGRRTEGGYQRINFSASRLNAIVASTVAFVSYSYQYASKNLDASEKIGLGGPNAVRAYAVGEATSDEAHLVNAEVRTTLPQPSFMPGNLVGLAFFDWARGRLNKDPLALEAANNIRVLRGVGFGLTWSKQDDFLVRGTLAWRLSGAPLSDPQEKKPRVFFQLQKNL
jgi:hemolysin activation/secretion protein